MNITLFIHLLVDVISMSQFFLNTMYGIVVLLKPPKMTWFIEQKLPLEYLHGQKEKESNSCKSIR
jgi:hypothetical protein